MNDKLKKMMMMVIGGFVILLLFLFLISACQRKYTPQKLELKIFESAKNYFSIHDDELPSEGNIKSYSINDLVSLGIIKDLEKILEKDTLCSGNLTIENNNNYYMYSPNLNCSGKEIYKSENLKELLLQNVVSSGNGLYQLYNAYYFRGDEVNNYIMFDGLLWRISKINDDGTIRLIEVKKRDIVTWDDRFNEEESTASGKNNFIDNGLNSRIKDNLDSIYNSEDVLSNDAKGYIKQTNLCVGKRTEEETINDGSIECSEVIENQYLGLLQLNEYLIASLDVNCQKSDDLSCKNYNYLSEFINAYWTLTADASNSYKVFKITTTPFSTRASTSGVAKLVINISTNTFVSGKGTEEEPYLVVGMSNELKEIKK